MTFDFAIVLPYWDVLLKGLGVTLAFTSLAGIVGVLGGFLLCLCRLARPAWLRALASGYVNLFRGTPVLIQLFWIFFCLPALLQVDMPPWLCVFIALTLYTIAMTCETFRGALKSVPPEQHDACVALGLTWPVKIVYVIFPQALLRAIPPLLSNLVSLFKESALISSVGIADLMYAGQSISNAIARPVEFLTAVAVIYFAVAFPLTCLVGRIEQRLLPRFS